MASDVTVVVTARQHPALLEQFYAIAIQSSECATVALTYVYKNEDITDTLPLFLAPYGETSAVPTILNIPAVFFVQKTKEYMADAAFRILVEDADGEMVSWREF